MWPYISDYAKDILVETVQPAVNSNLPKALTPFEFITIDLGDTPPRIGGVKVYMEESLKRNEIMMDLDLMLYSDARIKVMLGKIKAGVKEFELRGTLRVLMRPLVPKVPFAGAVTVCFLDSPYINFTLTDVANLLGLPGLQQTLSNVVRDVVNQLIVLPNRLPVQLVDNVDLQRLKYPMPQGVLRIYVISGRKLKVGDKTMVGRGSSDPYCIVRVGAHTFKTVVVKQTLEPNWNEYFEAIVDVARGQSLELEVYDEDQGNKDDELGITSIPIESVYDRAEIDSWVALENVKTGSVHLKLGWFDFSSDPSDFTEADKKALEYRKASGRSMSSGFLYVVVERATNLRRVKQMQEPSSYCHLIVGREAQMTVVKERTQSPTWDSVHHFLVGDPFVDVLQIIVRDCRSEDNLGSCTIPLKQLLTQSAMIISRPFPLKDSGPEGAMIHLHLQLMALVPGTPKKVDSLETSAQLSDVQLESKPEGSPTATSEVKEAPTAEEQPETVLRNRVQPTPSPVHSPGSVSLTPAQTEDNVEPKGRTSSPVPSPNQPSSDQPIARKSPSPNKDTAPEAPLGRIRVTLQYRSTSNVLEVLIQEAENLTGVDKDGLSDPYVKLYLVDRRGAIKSEKKKTRVHKDELNPVFDEFFEFTMDVDEFSSLAVRLDVKNHVGRFTRSGHTHQMGSAQIQLIDLLTAGSVTNWYTLVPTDSLVGGDTESLYSAD
ncbi:unnamed protein product [Calicophoron daubneyi]|uniref:Extended synaptotagmin-2 n=1 Tax=Calicophoron daubneyi TaxID=300641 RepID=A0AAV2TGN3_CALDB